MKFKFYGETNHKNGIRKHQIHSTNLSNTEITNTLLQAETRAINNIIKLGIAMGIPRLPHSLHS